jgi:hypothetical protein
MLFGEQAAAALTPAWMLGRQFHRYNVYAAMMRDRCEQALYELDRL